MARLLSGLGGRTWGGQYFDPEPHAATDYTIRHNTTYMDEPGTYGCRREVLEWNRWCKGPSEKLIIPTFSGEGEGGELGTSAGSYLRQVDAWERMTKLAPCQRALVLYQHLEGAAWINAEALNMEALSADDGVAYLR